MRMSCFSAKPKTQAGVRVAPTVSRCRAKLRSAKHTKADWHLTTADDRIKLKRLYPTV